MNRCPLVTVITSTFNAEKDIESSIKSIIEQSYPNIQYIIIDGGSTDSTLDIIKKYEKNISVLISEKDFGIYDAWNKGLKYAKGEWITFIGADDTYFPDAIESYIELINKVNNPNLHLVSSKINLVAQDSKILRVVGEQWRWPIFKIYMNIAHVGAFHSKHFFEKFGEYDCEFKIVGDYEMLLRPKDKLVTAFLDKITVNMRIGGISNIHKHAFKEVIKAKITTGARTSFQAHCDNVIANIKYYVRTVFLDN